MACGSVACGAWPVGAWSAGHGLHRGGGVQPGVCSVGRGVCGHVACGRGQRGVVWPSGRDLWAWPDPAGPSPSFPNGSLWKAGPHLHGCPGPGDGDARASLDIAYVVDALPGEPLFLSHLGSFPCRWEGDCTRGVLERKLGCWGLDRAGQLSWALPLIGADMSDADRRYC